MSGPKTPSPDDAIQRPPEKDPSDAMAGADRPDESSGDMVDASSTEEAAIDNLSGENRIEPDDSARASGDTEDDAISRTMTQLYRED